METKVQSIEVTTSKMLVVLEKGEVMEFDLEFLNDSILEKESMRIALDYRKGEQVFNLIQSRFHEAMYNEGLFLSEEEWLLTEKERLLIEEQKKILYKEYPEAASTTANRIYQYLHDTEKLLRYNCERDWHPSYQSMRMLELTQKNIHVHESIAHVVNNSLVFNFVTHTAVRHGSGHYTRRWPAQLWINNYFVNSEQRRDNPIRLMWVNTKTKKAMFGVSPHALAAKKMLPKNKDVYHNAIDLIEFNLKEILPILEWYERDGINEVSYERNKLDVSALYPLEITMSDIYWIGGETSLKKILNKAYRNSHGITKGAFGGLNRIQEIGGFQILRDAITAVRILRGFSPQTLEKISPWALHYFHTRRVNDLSQFVKEFEYFFKMFGHKEHYIEMLFRDNVFFQEEISQEMFPDLHPGVNITDFIKRRAFTYGGYVGVDSLFPIEDHINWGIALKYVIPFRDRFLELHGKVADDLRSVSDTTRMMKLIRSPRLRRAIIDHVGRNKMTMMEIHDFVLTEFNKIKQENVKLNLNKISKSLKQHDGKEIAPGITLVMPKMAHDLVEWGATQNNCIGSYVNRVNDGHSVIVGFKDSDDKWIGHAEIDPKDLVLRQLLAKHNKELPEKEKEGIVKFLKKSKINCSNFWGS